MKYTILRDGHQFGPYSAEEIGRFLNEGRLIRTDLAWAPGMTQWVPVPGITGAQSPQAVEAPVSFATALTTATPAVFVAPAILGINILVFILMVLQGVSGVSPTIQNLLDWGADYGPLTLGEHQWWRIVASTFLHIGVIHLLFNMYVLYRSGVLIERLFGNFGFLVLYVISGLGGSLVSLAWHPHVVSAGASGAIFGLYGGLMAFLVLHRHTIPRETVKSLTTMGLVFIGYNMVFGFLKSGVDVGAHLGGLAAGFLAGLLLSQPLRGVSLGARLLRGSLVLVLGGATALAGVLTISDAAVPEVHTVEAKPVAKEAPPPRPIEKTEAAASGAWVFTKGTDDRLSCRMEQRVGDDPSGPRILIGQTSEGLAVLLTKNRWSTQPATIGFDFMDGDSLTFQTEKVEADDGSYFLGAGLDADTQSSFLRKLSSMRGFRITFSDGLEPDWNLAAEGGPEAVQQFEACVASGRQ